MEFTAKTVGAADATPSEPGAHQVGGGWRVMSIFSVLRRDWN
jgi:hypothetical protein